MSASVRFALLRQLNLKNPMGLSDPERISKIYFSLYRMTKPEVFESLKERFPDIAELLPKLWPAWLGGKGNGAYWILGSGVDNEVMDRPSLFATAICGNHESSQADDLEDHLDDWWTAQIDAAPSPEAKAEIEEKHAAATYQRKHRPEFESVLRRSDPALAEVYQLFEECEHIRYALNRYKDELSAKGKELDDLVSNLLGRCFAAFTSDFRFRAAWYTYQIARKFIYLRIGSDDTVVKIWREGWLHHDLGLEVHNVEDLHKYWAKLQKKGKLSTQERVLGTLWLLDRRFHYEHKLKEMLRILDKHNLKHPTDQVDLEKVRRFFERHNVRNSKRYESRWQNRNQYCELTGQVVTAREIAAPKARRSKKVKKKTKK